MNNNSKDEDDQKQDVSAFKTNYNNHQDDDNKMKIMKVKNMSVMCSNGETVPVKGCFAAPLTSGVYT